MTNLSRTIDSQRVFEVQISVLLRSFPFALGGSVVSACVVAYVMLAVVPRTQVTVWLSATVFVAACRFVAMLYFYRVRQRPGAGERWLRQMVAGNVASGVLWGLPFAYWTFFVPLEYQLFFIVVLFGLGTGAIYSNYMVLSAVYAFLVPTFAPTFIALATQPSAVNLALVASGVAYLVATVAFIHRMNRTHLNALQLSYENLALLQQVRLEKEAAERSDLEKSRFLAAASHDLRQPVHAMSLFLGLLTNERLSEHGRYLVENITKASAAMGHLFDALLNISRLDAGVIHPRLQNFPLDRLLDQIRTEYTPQAQQKGLALKVRHSKAWVYSDPMLLERILRNLISNAIAHTPGGRVLIGCRMRGGCVRIEVWDTGPGIPPHEHERIFWEFHQLQNPERDRSKGLGLGLAIVRRTAALLGHALAMRSIEGRGTAFLLSVESKRASVVEAPVAAGALGATAGEMPLLDTRPAKGQLILVVDDDAQNREGLQLLLESWGHRVVAAPGVSELVALIADVPGKPNLIVSDYRLREHETGIEAIDRVHEEYNDDAIPALLVSGDTDPARLIEAAARSIPVLHKPVEVEALRSWVEKLLVGGAAPGNNQP
ncbi:hybrid sensor histidine kinase/response regulator [Variovorax sp. EL159]|uniref:ATP-binding response regulator n=1 Tax=Variovorax sp. EL159 TaxID=1566270 RepID=UPI000883D3A6|nr:hybrid sensor histidine kinase/response regulator [Variovorax sp. EL159]SCX74185.1 Signal transduction histidine kinase [Variovorax sp. EL159]